MQSDFWNKRYSEKEYAYGKKPNIFVTHQTFTPNSRILCLAEGEGRNAVCLASLGHDVTLVDYSSEGLIKANLLAKEKGVSIVTLCKDLSDYELTKNNWDAIIIIFGHLPSPVRQFVHSQIYSALKSNGKLILEAYSKEQLKYKTGGPQDVAMLYSIEELGKDFNEFESLSINKFERKVVEGSFHNGLASVIQLSAIKS